MILLARRPCTKSPFHVWCKTQLPSCFATGQLWVNFLSSLQKCNIKIVKIINLQFWEEKKNRIKRQTWDSNFLQFWPFLRILSLDLIILISFSVFCLSHEKEMKKVIAAFLSYNSDVISHNSDFFSLNSKITSHSSVFLSFFPTTEKKNVRVLSHWSDVFLVMLQSPDTCVFFHICVSVRFEFAQAVHSLVHMWSSHVLNVYSLTVRSCIVSLLVVMLLCLM